MSSPTVRGMADDRRQRVHDEVARLARARLDWVTFTNEATEAIRKAIGFDRCCWHTVDPGTVLFTGSLNRGVGCSGTWLAEYEYVVEDVNKWWYLARSGHVAGATSAATHGDLSRSARHRSREAWGIGDELRGSFVAGGTYWGAAGFLRDSDQPWFTEEDVRFLADLSEILAGGLRRALVTTAPADDVVAAVDGPGVIVFDRTGRAELISPAAEHWIEQLVEEPPPNTPADSKMVQSVVVRTRALAAGNDPLHLAARSRARTRSGSWLLLYGTPLAGDPSGRVAVIVQPAAPNDVAPLVALAYGLTDRERQVVRQCMNGRSTKEIATELNVTPYTVQDHLKSIFDKTGVRTRNELVGQIFLEHYCPRWETLDEHPPGWIVLATPPTP